MWAIGRYDLKLNEEEFWGLTLKEFGLLVERYNAEIERQDFRVALVCALIANIYRDDKRHPEPFTPQDFLPDYGTVVRREPMEEDEKEELDYLLELTKNLGGQVVVHEAVNNA